MWGGSRCPTLKFLNEGGMLEGLEDIDWEKLSCPEMPRWIRGLASLDAEVCEDASDNIYGHSCQYLSDISPYMIPFLIELLSYPQTRQKETILLLIMQLTSDAYIYRSDDKSSELTKRVLNEAAKGIEIYPQFLNPQDFGITHIILWLLRCLDHKADYTVPIILSMLAKTFDDKVQIEIAETLGALIGNTSNNAYRSKYFAEMSRLMSPQAKETVRIAAAVSVINVLKKDVPQNVIDVILEVFSDSDFDAKFTWIRHLVMSISQLEFAKAVPILIKILTRLTDTGDVFTLIPILLNLGFNDGEIVSYSLSSTLR